MDLLEVNTHSFIVRIWLEEVASEDKGALWRGYVRHVPTGEQQYLESLEDILLFIGPYLSKMGMKLRFRSRVLLWLNRLRYILTPD